MKKMIMSVLAVLALVSAAQPARAELRHAIWDCSLTFKAEGSGLQIILGSFELAGDGHINCVDIAGNTEQLPVRVTLGGEHIAARVAIVPYMAVQGIATGIGLAGGPQDLLGGYVVANASGAFILGGSGTVGVHGTDNALNLDLGLSLAEGFGIEAGFSNLRIEAR